jgi:Lsr2
MAQKVTVALEDDLTGGPADETVRFAVDGTGYEIDLSTKNARAFSKLLAPYIEHARKAGRAQGRRAGRTASSPHPGERGGAVPRRGRRALTTAQYRARRQVIARSAA